MFHSIAREVRPQIELALSASPIYDLRDLAVEITAAGIVISGSVSSFYHKQLAQEAVRAVAGEFEVINQVEVRGQAEVRGQGEGRWSQPH